MKLYSTAAILALALSLSSGTKDKDYGALEDKIAAKLAKKFNKGGSGFPEPAPIAREVPIACTTVMDDVWEEKCRTEYRNACHMTTVPKCRTVSSKECAPKDEQQCSFVMEQKCSKIPIPFCDVKWEKKCVNEPVCTTITERACETVEKQVCVTHTDKQCSMTTEKVCIKKAVPIPAPVPVARVQDFVKTYDVKGLLKNKLNEKLAAKAALKNKGEHGRYQRDLGAILAAKAEFKAAKSALKAAKYEKIFAAKAKGEVHSGSFGIARDVSPIRIEYVEECHDEPRSHCVDVPREACHVEPLEKCQAVPRESCVDREKCTNWPNKQCGFNEKETCVPIPVKKCTNVARNVCTVIPREECLDVEHEVCESVPEKICEKLIVQRPRQVCPQPATTRMVGTNW